MLDFRFRCGFERKNVLRRRRKRKKEEKWAVSVGRAGERREEVIKLLVSEIRIWTFCP